MFRSARLRSLLLLAALAGLGAAGLGSAGAFAPDARLHHLSASLGAPLEHASARAGVRRSLRSSAAPHPVAVRRAEAAGLRAGDRWVASWGAAIQPPSAADPISERGFRAATLREIAFSATGGSLVRVRFTNAFGRRPLVIARAALALSATGPDVAVGTSRKLTFAGRPNVTLPAGRTVLSDPVLLTVKPLSRLAVSLYVPKATGPATQLADSHETNWIASGSHILNRGGAFSRRTPGWFFLDSIDVLAPRQVIGAVLAIGDSITAGVGTGRDSDAGWPDDLARRLQDLPGSTLSVVDAGIGGNRVLNDSPCCGQKAIERFSPEVLSQDRVRDVVLLEGINDIGYSLRHDSMTAPHADVSAAQIITGLEQIAAQAHRHHLRIFGGTLLPFKGARYWSPAGEAKREDVNRWMLSSRAFDGVIDFATVMADPAHPLRLDPAYDSGDHLHPNAAGYQAMANTIDLASLLPAPAAGGP